MKFYLFPPSVKNEAKVIDFLNWSCSKLNTTNHYDFLKKMRDAKWAAFCMMLFWLSTIMFDGWLILPLAIAMTLFGFYILVYTVRCNAIMEAFHMNHLENITEQDLQAFQKKR